MGDMHPSRVLRLVPLILVGLDIAASAQLKFQSTGPVILRGGEGAVEITLMNPGKDGVTLDLKPGSLTDKASHAMLSAPKITFVLDAGGASLPAKVEPSQALQVKATISNLVGSSTGELQLFNGGTALGKLDVVSIDAPLNISIDGEGTSDKPLAFAYGKIATITLKNGDGETYPVEWTFQISGMKYPGTLILGPKGSSRIDLAPAKMLYSWRDLVHPSTQTGFLMLQLQGPEGVAKELLPARSLPVSVSMMRNGPNRTVALSYCYATFFLLAGGILSLLGNSVLPNLLRKIALRAQINDLADRTSSVSTRVDSYLRVLLRLERKNIDILLQSTGLFSLTTVDTLDQVSTAIDKLTKRLTVAERLDELRREFETAAETAPPSVIDDVDKQLQAAANQLHSFALPDDNLVAANTFLDKAQASLAAMDDPDALAKLVAGNFKTLKTRVIQFPDAYYADLKVALPGIFQILDKPFDDPKNITAEMAFAVDHSIAAIQTAFDYAMVRASIPSGASKNCPQPGTSITQRLVEHECALIAQLGTLSWQAVRAARTLVREMREDIYEKDVIEEVGKEGQAAIVFDTQKARPYLPVYFSIAFKDPRFNSAAAINCLVCRWDFPGDLHENGWKVCHFFQGNEFDMDGGRKITITATIQSEKAAGESGATETIKGVIEIQSGKRRAEYSRAIAESLRFSIAFGVALAGLLSGALGQLEKLDLLPATIAVIALGFGADSIKNLLTQTPGKASS